MRKRERVRIAKRLKQILETAHKGGVGQLDGSIWYMEAGAEIKCLSFAYAAQEQLEKASKDLKYYLKYLQDLEYKHKKLRITS